MTKFGHFTRKELREDLMSDEERKDRIDGIIACFLVIGIVGLMVLGIILKG